MRHSAGAAAGEREHRLGVVGQADRARRRCGSAPARCRRVAPNSDRTSNASEAVHRRASFALRVTVSRLATVPPAARVLTSTDSCFPRLALTATFLVVPGLDGELRVPLTVPRHAPAWPFGHSEPQLGLAALDLHLAARVEQARGARVGREHEVVAADGLAGAELDRGEHGHAAEAVDLVADAHRQRQADRHGLARLRR